MQTNTTMLVINANLAKQELLIIHLPEDVKVTQLAKLDKHSIHRQEDVKVTQLAKLDNHIIHKQEDVKTMLSDKTVLVTPNSAPFQTPVSNAHLAKPATTRISYALSHHRIATTTAKFNWVKINVINASHALQDRLTTVLPDHALTK